MEETSYDPGIAGSIVFSSLTVAVILLLISFYRRYKRLQLRALSDQKPREPQIQERDPREDSR
jgi:hypothetical protein